MAPIMSWNSSIIVGAVAGICAGITLAGLRWLIAVTLSHHDRSALIYLGTRQYFQRNQLDVKALGNVPIYPDNQRRYELHNELYTNNDPRDILGFVIDEPRFVKDPPHDGECGYYVYVVINWQYADQFKQWAKRGFVIQISGIGTANRELRQTQQDDRHLLISPFGRDRANECKVWDICDGLLYSFRWQPYKKWGFAATDLGHRTRSWQSKLLINTGRTISWLKSRSRHSGS